MAVIKVAITKGKGSLDVDTDALPENVYKEVVAQGLKVLLNRGMTKITVAKLTGDDLAKAMAAAMEVGQKNLENLLAGKVRITAAKGDGKVPGVVMTEARRIAKQMVKDMMKREGIKLRDVDAKDITAAANALIASDETIIAKAQANIDSVKEEGTKVADILAGITKAIPINEKKKAKNEAEAAEKKKERQLSAAQAGKTNKRKPAQASA